jgi:hypothetical protein
LPRTLLMEVSSQAADYNIVLPPASPVQGLFVLLCGWQYDERLLWLLPRKFSMLILLTR